MSEFVVDPKSWHYRMLDRFLSGTEKTDIDNGYMNFCQYVRLVFVHVAALTVFAVTLLIAVVGWSIGIFDVITVLWNYFATGAWDGISIGGKFALATISAAALIGFVFITVSALSKMMNKHSEKEPGIVSKWFEAKMSKVCVSVRVKNE
jgi:hypothetical protein